MSNNWPIVTFIVRWILGLKPGHVLHVDAGIARQAHQHLSVIVVADGRDKSAINAKPREVLGNIAGNAAG